MGCGYLDAAVGGKLQCGASGGSHGTIGGFPGSEINTFFIACMQQKPFEQYGNPFNPIFEGSGGGNRFYGGSGGGVIYIEVAVLL